MENNTEPKALTDLIENPSEISAIISDPADSGVKFYQSLSNKDKQYVAFAAGLGLIGYGIYLNRMSKKNSPASSPASQGQESGGASSGTSGGTKTLNVKRPK